MRTEIATMNGFAEAVREEMQGFDSFAIVQIYPHYNGGIFEKTAEEIHNFVRGLSPYPAAWANLTINGQAFENVKIYKVEISKYRDIEISKNDIIVPCKEGAVRILELQAPGKKRMLFSDYLRGHPVETGTVLE